MLKVFQALLRQGEERLVVALERLGGQGIEGVRQFEFGLAEQRQLLFRRFPLCVQRGLELGTHALELRHLPLQRGDLSASIANT